MLLCFGKKRKLLLQFLEKIYSQKVYLKNVMEYSLPEATIGAKWECVWNGNILSNVQLITEIHKSLNVKIH